MGLDMYLYRKIDKGSKNPLFTIVPSNFLPKGLFKPDAEYLTPEITVNAGYWRKANAIHAWFVQNADVEDNCEPIQVDLDDLTKLRSTIEDIFNAKEEDIQKAIELAKNTLAPTAGFFFGDTEIDEDYFNSLQYTYSIINREINFAEQLDKRGHNFALRWEYQASW